MSYVDKDTLVRARDTLRRWACPAGLIAPGVRVRCKLDDDTNDLRIVATETLAGDTAHAHELDEDALTRLLRLKAHIADWNDGHYVRDDAFDEVWWRPEDEAAAAALQAEPDAEPPAAPVVEGVAEFPASPDEVSL